METGGRQSCRNGNFFDLLQRVHLEEADIRSVGDREYRPVAWDLDAVRAVLELDLLRFRARRAVPNLHQLVLRAANDALIVTAKQSALDGARVARVDLHGWIRRWLVQVEDPQQLLVVPGQ